MKYRISGANSVTGEEVNVDVDAATEQDALQVARRLGMFVSSATPATTTLPPPQMGKAMGGTKLFVIATGGVACGIIAAAICYYIFFVAASAVPRAVAATSGQTAIGVHEKAFLDAINAGEPDLVREYLVESLDWKQVATPALDQIMGRMDLHEWGFESAEDKQKREFWFELSDRLIKNGADVNAALHQSHSIDALRFLVAHKANVNSPDETGDTALHEFSDDIYDDSSAFLIASGANVNAKGYEGNTPLHDAAKKGATKIISRLLAAGASINAKNDAGKTPLAIAEMAMQKDAAALLKSRGGKE